MDEKYYKRLKLVMEIAEKTISSALLITKVLANDSFSSFEKAYIANTIAERTRHEIAIISNRDYFNRFKAFEKGCIVSGDKVSLCGTNETVIKKEDLFNMEKIKAEIERLTNDE